MKRTPSGKPLPAARRSGSSTQRKLLLERARHLRSNLTEAEQRLWYHLRAGRFMGLKFRRQKPIGPYIVDFVCFSPPLIVEVDGGQHSERAAYDSQRDSTLRRRGFTVLRFWNNAVLSETDAVLGAVRAAALAHSDAE